ncbi:MAG TPA: MFS transporter [Pseudonocardiaceae bacterium]|nr:MFS transporter [Pseudonocardiaceae bacterium]
MFSRLFVLHLSSTTISALGSAAAPVAIAFTVLRLGGNAGGLGAVGVCGLGPALLFFLVGGVIADRWPRHLVLVGANSVSAVVQATLAVLVCTDRIQLWHLMLAAAVNGLCTAFAMPAAQGLLMRGVDRAKAGSAFALFRLGLNLAQIGGAALGGLLFQAAGPGWVLVIDSATFVIAVVIRLFMRIDGTITVRGAALRDFVEGWREFRSHRWLGPVILQFAAINMLAVGAFELVLGPLQAGAAGAWGTVLACDAVGMVLGGLLLVRVKPTRLLVAALAGGGLTVLPMLSMAAGAPLVVICAAALLGGFGVELFGVNLMTALRQEVAPEKISRVSSYQSLAAFGLTPVGVAVAGPLASALSVRATLSITSALLLVAGAVAIARPAVTRFVRSPAPASRSPRPAAPASP